jgi:hypothetical protein
MRGVVLAGGTGSRLNPLTKVTNKHLLPVYDEPMVYYPVQTLVNAGIREILLVTGGKNAGDFLRLLGNGRDFGLKHLNDTYQRGRRWNRRSAWFGGRFCRRQSRLRRTGRQHHRNEYLFSCRGVQATKMRSQNSLEGSSGCREIWGRRNSRKLRCRHRRKAQNSEVELCRRWSLSVRQHSVRENSAPESFGSRRAGNHGRQQLLRSGRKLDLRNS